MGATEIYSLRNLRRARTLTQAQMASLIGVSQKTWSRYENRLATPPRDVQALIAAILGSTVNELFPQVAA